MIATEPKLGSTRIVKADAHNYAVERYEEIENTTKNEEGKRERSGTFRREWKEVGYYGHRLDWAAESAIFEGIKNGSEITKQLLKECVKEIVQNTQVNK
jgi:hypothetical protein